MKEEGVLWIVSDDGRDEGERANGSDRAGSFGGVFEMGGVDGGGGEFDRGRGAVEVH